MTVREAREFLRTSIFPKPKFGDGATIEAVEIVGLYDKALELARKMPLEECTYCDGDGVTTCFACEQEVTCDDCGGSGVWDSEYLEMVRNAGEKVVDPKPALRNLIKEMEEELAASKEA